MKLGEALTLRSQLLARIAQIRERLTASALVQEGEKPPEDPKELLREFESMAAELEGLIAQINRTNIATQLPTGETLTNALARRDILGLRQAVLRQVANTAGEQQQRYGKAEIRILPTVDVGELRRRGDELARERRELDTVIQETNWTTELVE
jgi:Family of unknown function (DUF6847)